MNSSPLRSAILQPLSPERAAGTQQVDKISVSSGNTSSLVLNANLWAVARGSKLSARLPWGHSVLSRLEMALIEEIDPQLEGFLDDRPAVFLVKHPFAKRFPGQAYQDSAHQAPDALRRL